MAISGFGYWALVATAIVSPAIFAICVWAVTQWIPGLPRYSVGIGSMLRFGGTVTLNGVRRTFQLSHVASTRKSRCSSSL